MTFVGRVIRIAMTVAIIVSVASCSNEKKVGSAIDVDELAERNQALGQLEKKKQDEGGFVGEAEKKQEVAKQQSQQQSQAAQQEAVAKQKEAAAVNVSITASGYDPYVIRVFTGGVLRVTNNFDKPATVTADRGEFDSGPIAPGGTWTYEPKTPGKFNFHDENRPFVVGTLEVIAQ
jgi:plastocyanin